MGGTDAIRVENTRRVNVCRRHGSIILLNAPRQPEQVGEVFAEWEWLHGLKQAVHSSISATVLVYACVPGMVDVCFERPDLYQLPQVFFKYSRTL